MAARYFINGGVNSNWSSTSNWSLTSGGAGGQSVPAATDDVFFDANSPNCILDTAVAKVARTINFSGYSGTTTHNVVLTVSGPVTLSPTQTFSGASAFAINSGGTLTANSKVLNLPFTLQGTNMTYTLADNWVIAGLFTCNGTTTTTINGPGSITAASGYTQTTVTTVNGTARFYLTGGTWTSTLSTNVLRLNTELNDGVVLGTNVAYNSGTLTCTAATANITSTNSTFTCAAATTLHTSAMTWNNVVMQGAVTYTLNSDLNIGGTFTVGTTTSTSTFNGANINIGANLSLAAMSTGIVAGTSNFIFCGTTAFSPMTSTGSIRVPIVINTPNTITINNTGFQQLRMISNSFTYVNGTFIMPKPTNIFGANTVFVFNNPFSCSTLFLSTGCVFSGTAGANIDNLYLAASAQTHVFEAGNTYTIKNILSANTSVSFAPIILSSDSNSNRAFITLEQGAIQKLGFVNASWIDSSQGQTIRTYDGILSNCRNWSALTVPGTISFAY